MSTGIYIHIPYCAQKCPYCDFYSLPYTKKSAEDYTAAIIKRIESYRAKELSADTVYFGGGTPNLIGADRIKDILDKIKGCFILTDDAEITLEANPESLSRQSIGDFAKAGINRLSLGLQSADKGELEHLGRQHTPNEVAFCVKEAKAAGIDNISLDLMLGLEGQTKQSLKSSIEFCADLGVSHISAYMLKIEPGTPFYKKQALLSLPDEEQTCELYLLCISELENRGYKQYEISNFAKDGKKSRHNLKYWNCEHYIGIGASAHGFEGSERYYYPRSITDFIEDPLNCVSDGAGGGAEEAFMLKLRLSEGVDLASFKKKYSINYTDQFFRKLENFKKAGLMGERGNRIFLTKKGFLLSNSIIAALLDAMGI
ncbi:MAG: radical SAM family heme chaperone HemW [Ruminococcaceae bacterium]|nr:radical SAM family heme chaperone HemW [Oscillospiraceae bacterium]